VPIRSFSSPRSPALQRFAPVFTLAAVYVCAGSILRALLWWQFGRVADVSAATLAWIIPVGLINDLVESAYLLLPLSLYIGLMPDRWYRSRPARAVLAFGSAVTLTAMTFLCFIEYYFFQEFDARFNLVAVDYLVYPTEVIGDIRDAYPVGSVLLLAAVSGLTFTWWLRRRLVPPRLPVVRIKRRMSPALAQVAAVGLAFAFFSTDSLTRSDNRVANEIAANGAMSFFRAARTSELPYTAYYATRDSRKNFQVLTSYLARTGGRLTALGDGRLNRRFAADPRGLGKLNVVVVAEESFGAEFSKLYGSEQDLTPNFDRYARQALWFRHMYASGTRTVRGLEAIATSFPPIPSVSILRRPRNEGIATWGSVMRRHGYDASFLYGGYGYFDNMNYFFENNGFSVLDRNDMERVRFENIWGVSDEDLFDRALAYYDERHSTGKAFFSLVMTTSNHKPFTFRDGVPGVPASGGGRAAGVRYADFALGYFLDEARKRGWFHDTLFVVVADHGARVYGKAEIPLRQYEIPMMFYAPAHLARGMIETLTTQIDIAPTVLGLLGLEYEAPFFGTNVLACAPCERVALFSHNHDVAAFRDGKLAVLGLGKREQVLAYDRALDSYRRVAPDPQLLNLTIAIYQTAYEQFQAHTYE
jgi:phosphoglycerol transferase MdoB-like AlkP superfamily enzyme